MGRRNLLLGMIADGTNIGPASAQHSLLLVFSQRILVNKGDSCCIANKNFPENLHGIPQLAPMTGMPVIVWLYNFSLN